MSQGLLNLMQRSTRSWNREANSIQLAKPAEAGLLARPTNVGVTYVEKEYAALGQEQEQIWLAEGEAKARSAHARARGLDQVVASSAVLLSESARAVQRAHADHQTAVQVLSPLVRREPGAKLRYWLGWLILVIGDAAGILNAAITHGEIPLIALGQALACGLAVACAGLVGGELRNYRMARARHRAADTLIEDELPYRQLFIGKDAGIGAVVLVGGLSLVVVGLLGLGIFYLRAGVEGQAAGLTFGLLAVGTALGSVLLGYAATDEVADLLERSAKRVRRAEQRHQLAAARPARQQAAAEEAARVIHEENRLRGLAARSHVEALGQRVLRRHPEIFGHGYPLVGIDGLIGRRLRPNPGAGPHR